MQGWATPKQNMTAPATTPVLPRWTTLADKWNISVGKTKFQGLWGQGEVDGHKVVLLKPLTYMNLSGDSIAPMAGFFKIPADHVHGALR